MEHPFAPDCPCYRNSSQQCSFCSLNQDMETTDDSLDSLDSPARLKVGCTTSRESVRRAAQAAKEANVRPARMYLRSTSRGLRQFVDIYMPVFKQDSSPVSSEGEQEDDAGNQTEPVSPQTEGLSCRGTFRHFRRLGKRKLMDRYVNASSLEAKNHLRRNSWRDSSQADISPKTPAETSRLGRNIN
nr:uncharacterized protein LOC108082727 [Drosophila kikkawai]